MEAGMSPTWRGYLAWVQTYLPLWWWLLPMITWVAGSEVPSNNNGPYQDFPNLGKQTAWLTLITSYYVFFVWFLCCFSVDVCQRFLQDEEILLLAVGAIQNLVRDSYVNRCRLADSDGLIVLSRIYRASESEAIKTKCLHALRNLVGKYMWVIYSLLWAGIWAFHHSGWTSRMRKGSILASKSRLVFRRPFDWLKACRELFWPITERSNAKQRNLGLLSTLNWNYFKSYQVIC